jgi:hypothetical protein
VSLRSLKTSVPRTGMEQVTAVNCENGNDCMTGSLDRWTSILQPPPCFAMMTACAVTTTCPQRLNVPCPGVKLMSIDRPPRNVSCNRHGSDFPGALSSAADQSPATRHTIQTSTVFIVQKFVFCKTRSPWHHLYTSAPRLLEVYAAIDSPTAISVEATHQGCDILISYHS